MFDWTTARSRVSGSDLLMEETMIDIIIAAVLSAIISYFAVLWQQPSTQINGIINVVVVFALTYIIYYAIKSAMFSSRTKTIA